MKEDTPEGTKTGWKIPHTSLCRKVNLSIPSAWSELTQAQLERVLHIMIVLDGQVTRMKMAVAMNLCGVEVERQTSHGYLCRKLEGNSYFILDPELLPAIMETVAWLDRPEDMSVRLEKLGGYEAYDFKLRTLPFGKWLELENYYQAFLSSSDKSILDNLVRVLYNIPDDKEVESTPEHGLGAFLWVNAVKQELGRWFPNFFKPASEGALPSQESQYEATMVQIRLLTGGDVTKQKYVLTEVGTWDAFAELDARAKENEDMKQKYGK